MSTDDTTPGAPRFNTNDDDAARPADSSSPLPGQDPDVQRTDGHGASAPSQAENSQPPQASGSAQSAYQAPVAGQHGPAGQPQHGMAGQPQQGDQGQFSQSGQGQPQYGHQNQGSHGASGQPQYGEPNAHYGAPAYGAAGGQGYQTGSQGYHGGPQGYQQDQQQGYQSGPYQFSGMQPQDARLWATLTHLAAPALYLLSAGFAGFVAPLILWLIFKEKDPLVRQAGAGSFNFNFALMLISIASWILGIVTLGLLLPLTGLVLTIVFIVQVVFGILGAMAANKGQSYKYPFQVGILK